MRPNTPTMNSQQAPKSQIFSYIAPCSLQYNAIKIDEQKQTFSITLIYDSTSDLYISLFINVTETENIQRNLTEKFEIANKSAYETHSLCLAGVGKEIIKQVKFPLSQLTSLKINDVEIFPENRRYKIIIRMEPKMHPHRFVNCYYFNFESINNKMVPKLVKHKVEIKDNCYFLYEIYGIEVVNGTTVLTKNSIEQLCKICLDKFITIIVVPCRHMCLCLDCAQLYNAKDANNKKKMKAECPVCKTPIQGFLNIQTKNSLAALNVN